MFVCLARSHIAAVRGLRLACRAVQAVLDMRGFTSLELGRESHGNDPFIMAFIGAATVLKCSVPARLQNILGDTSVSESEALKVSSCCEYISLVNSAHLNLSLCVVVSGVDGRFVEC